MQTPHENADLVERLRLEIQKRKYQSSGESTPDLSSGALVDPCSSAVAVRSGEASTSTTRGKPRIKHAEGAFDRACAKNQVHRAWPRFLRGLRRNQQAVNESLIRGGRALLDTTEWLRGRVDLLGEGLAEIGRKIDRISLWPAEFQRSANERDRRLSDTLYRDAVKREREIEQRLRAEMVAGEGRAKQRHLELRKQQAEVSAAIEALAAQSASRESQYVKAAERIDGLCGQVSEFGQFVTAQQSQTRDEHKQLQELQTQVRQALLTGEEIRHGSDTRSRELEARLVDLGRRAADVERMRNKLNSVAASAALFEAHFLGADNKAAAAPPAPKAKLLEAKQMHESDAFYVAFEEQFRGSREVIKQRLSFYLPVIERAKADTDNCFAVDLGCGRGEWLELLQENGYTGKGVDLNFCMVEECKSRGLKVDDRDAILELANRPAESLALVTGFHIIEHLDFPHFYRLMCETWRVLRSGGVAIFETPNPECLKVSQYSFFLDPTHRNPMPQELLCFAASYAGFRQLRVERLQEYFEGGVSQGYLDYAGIFTK